MTKTTTEESQAGHASNAVSTEGQSDHWKRFAMVVAHDLKEPLRNASNCAKMLASIVKDESEETQQITRWLEESADRLQNMVDALLEHARHGAEALEIVDLNVLVHEVVADLHCLQRRTGGGVEIGPLPELKSGPLGMRLLFGNLIENALKYGSAGVAPRISVSSNVESGFDVIRIQDNGKGMSPYQMRHIFEPFRRFEHDVEGLGMGLSHVYNIVQGHGGDIEVESRVGEGTTFILRFPN